MHIKSYGNLFADLRANRGFITAFVWTMLERPSLGERQIIMSFKRLLSVLVILIVLGGIGYVAFISGSNYLAEQGAKDAGDAYLQALKDGDFAAAYNLSAPTLQAQFGNPAGVQSNFAERAFFPEEWNIHDTSLEDDLGTLQASVSLTNGQRTGITLDLSKIEGDWRISRVELISS
jgi:hypothetical protein